MKRIVGKVVGWLGIVLLVHALPSFALQSQPLSQQMSSPLASSPLTKPHSAIPYRQDQPMGGASVPGVLIAVVLLVAGAAFALRYGAKRGIRVPLRGLRNERLKLVEILHLSNRSRLYLVEVDGERLVVGEHQNSMKIQSLKAPNTPANDNSESPKN